MTSLRYPLELGRNGKFAVDISPIDKARSKIMATIVTAMGERVMRPNFGSDILQAYYLSGEDAISAVEDAITELFTKMTAGSSPVWADITLHSVTAEKDPNSEDGSIISVDVQWSYGDTVVTTSDRLSIQNLTQQIASM